MSEIDWSKAPAWAIGVGAVGRNQHLIWFNDQQYSYVHGIGEIYKFSSGMDVVFDKEKVFVIGNRPATPQWNGEGLPPVGCECEALWASATGAYVRVVVIGYDYDQSYAVYRMVCGARAGEYESSRQSNVEGYPCFRPIRTPEQIVAEEREKACEEMLKITKSRRSDPDVYEAIATLYDAGYRKQGAAK